MYIFLNILSTLVVQGVWGFIFGGLTWFAIPFTLATTMGLAYLGLSSAQGFPMLSDQDVTKGKNNCKKNLGLRETGCNSERELRE